jgi:xanthine dehydrogenase accessory factor
MLEIYRELVNITANGGRAILATVVSSKGSAPRNAGAKMIIKEDGSSIGSVGGGRVEHQVQGKAIELMNSNESQLVHFDLSGKEKGGMICGGQMDVFLEPIVSQETLYIFGAGHISQSTVTIATMLGFRVIVIDPRSEYNNIERFPDAGSLVVEPFEDSFSKLSVDKESYIVICTTGHKSDEPCVQFAVGTEAKYVGMMGSRKKVKEVKERLMQKGVSQQQLDRLHAPIGLAIGAETPQEIAMSIMSEIIKVRRGRDSDKGGAV